jgi:hypothetical protein
VRFHVARPSTVLSTVRLVLPTVSRATSHGLNLDVFFHAFFFQIPLSTLDFEMSINILLF